MSHSRRRYGRCVVLVAALLAAGVVVVLSGMGSRASAGDCSTWSLDSFDQCGTAVQDVIAYLEYEVDFTENNGQATYQVEMGGDSINIGTLTVKLDGGSPYNITTTPHGFTSVSATTHTFTLTAVLDDEESTGLACCKISRGYGHVVEVGTFIHKP